MFIRPVVSKIKHAYEQTNKQSYPQGTQFVQRSQEETD